jgi:hypothetical protein
MHQLLNEEGNGTFIRQWMTFIDFTVKVFHSDRASAHLKLLPLAETR